MNAAHLHLLINHLPILGAFLAVPLVVLALWRRHEPGTLYGAVFLVVAAGVGAVAADQTGDGAEESVEDLPGVSEHLIHEHEEAAEVAMVLALVTAAIGIGAAVLTARAGKVHPLATGILLSATLATSAAMANVGWAGGQIRHTEIREDGGKSPPSARLERKGGGEREEAGEEEEEGER